MSQQQLETSFYESRQKLIDGITDWGGHVDEPFIFTRRQRTAQYLSCFKIFERILGVSGSIVECGVDKGGTLMLYLQLCSILEPFGIGRKIYGFDTFDLDRPSTLPANRQGKDCNAPNNTSAYDLLQSAILMHDLNRVAAHIPKCALIKGDAKQSIPVFVQEHPELLVALLHLDFGDYDGTKTALTHFLPLMPKGAIVAINTLNFQKWSGDNLAFKELININKVKIERFSFNPWTSFYTIGE